MQASGVTLERTLRTLPIRARNFIEARNVSQVNGRGALDDALSEADRAAPLIARGDRPRVIIARAKMEMIVYKKHEAGGGEFLRISVDAVLPHSRETVGHCDIGITSLAEQPVLVEGLHAPGVRGRETRERLPLPGCPWLRARDHAAHASPLLSSRQATLGPAQ